MLHTSRRCVYSVIPALGRWRIYLANVILGCVGSSRPAWITEIHACGRRKKGERKDRREVDGILKWNNEGTGKGSEWSAEADLSAG